MIDNNNEFLGPFLCRPSHKSMGFWISRGPEVRVDDQIEIHIYSEGGALVEKVPLRSPFSSSIYGCAFAESSTSLSPDSLFTYQLVINGSSYLPQGLEKEDLLFRTLPDPASHDARIEFVLMSCHGIEEFQKHQEKEWKKDGIGIGAGQHDLQWERWDHLIQVLRSRPDCRFGVLGGDQVYMDETFGEDLGKFDPQQAPELIQKTIYSTYFKYWNNPSYRKVMARLPCFLMWDDHDLIDGWGSREEATEPSKMEKWTQYGKLLRTAFTELQASRNPPVNDSSAAFSFLWNWGKLGLLALDLRSTRKLDPKTKQSRMLSEEARQEADQLFELAKKNGLKTLFILSPVTVTRMSGRIEKLLGSISNAIWRVTAFLDYAPSGRRTAFWFFVCFAIPYFTLNLNTPDYPAVAQATLLLIIIFGMLLVRSKLAPYFSKKVWLIYNGPLILLMSTLTYLFGVLGNPFRVDFHDVGSKIYVAITSAAFEVAIGVGSILLSMALYGGYRRSEKKWMNFAGSAALIFFIIFSWWRGLPGWNFNLQTATTLVFIYVPLGLFTLLGLAVTLLEHLQVIDQIAGLDDDLKDAWSSEANATDLEWLGQKIIHLSRQSERTRSILLCGDIHTGGLSEVEFRTKTERMTVPQLTSSPMSYPAMPAIVEKLTSGSGEIHILDKGDFSCIGRNIFYRSQRNFFIVEVDSKSDRLETQVELYFEDLDKPVEITNV